MTDYGQLQQEASALRQNKRYAEALPLFEALYQQHRESCNEWDLWGYAQSLRKLGRSEEALAICRELYRQNAEFVPGRNLYGWCIYDTVLKHDDLREEDAISAVEAITGLTRQEDYSPYEWAVLSLLDFLKGRPNPDWELIHRWGGCLNPELMSTVPNRYTDSSGKERVNASPREKWYMTMTKALEELERFDECIEVCQQGLDSLPKLHHDNDVWFRWRIAKSKIGLRRLDEAVRDLHEILQRKQDWFISHELASVYFQLGDSERALQYAVTAALGHGDVAYKWKLFVLLADLLEPMGKQEEAQQHLVLAVKARQESEWDIPADLDSRVDPEAVSAAPSAKRLSRQLEGFWKSLKFEGQQRHTGSIKTVFPHGKAGFVTDEAGNDHYFQSQSYEGSPQLLRVGTKVTFYVEDSFDKRKNEKSTKAVHVKPVKNA